MGSAVDRGSCRGRGARGAALVAAILAITLATSDRAGAGARAFVDRPAPIADAMLFDLGVSDHDRDGAFEIFTTNHKFRGTFAERRPEGWVDLMVPSRLSPTPDFPGFENLFSAPRIEDPGLYLYALVREPGVLGEPEKQPRFRIVANQVNRIPLLNGPARGSVSFPSPRVQVVKAEGGQVTVRREGDPERTVVRFQIAGSAEIVLRVRKIDMPPIEVNVEGSPLRARTFVGAHRVPARSSSFVLRLVDRHGLAWVDANRDGISDVFIVRGGFGGGIARFLGHVSDDLLIGDGNGRFRGGGDAAAGLIKRGCRARQAAAIDYDRDGLVDLFSSCKRARPKLYKGIDSGYRPISPTFGRVAGSGGSFYRWADLRGNPRPELLVVGKRRARLVSFSHRHGWRVVQRIRTFNRNRLVHAVAVGDFNRDGHADLFVGAPSGNTLLVNRRGRLRAVKPRRVGLPGRGSAANWVDFDNDGRLDLHSLPAGLFRQQANGRFRATGLARGPKRSLWSIASWFDHNGDGARDLISATRTQAGIAKLSARLRENRRSRGNWLHLDLRGRPGNPDAIGAKVSLLADGRRQHGWVGQSEGSRHSQGHYRLYFGLGSADRIRRLAVRWPDGRRTVHRGLAVNRVLRLHEPR